MKRFDSDYEAVLAAGAPRLILLITSLLMAAGSVAAVAWWHTGDPRWIRDFFSYPGTLFFLLCGIAQTWFSFRCWSHFSQGDVLRPAWLLISLSAAAQLIRGVIRAFGLDYGPLFNPAYMILLAIGLFHVVKACRQNGMPGSVHAVDFLLLSIVVAYTVDFFATVVFSAEPANATGVVQKILSWTSDPLLCILLFQAILIRRSTSSMGWGLIARCWLSFMAAILLTSVGDMGLWAWSKGFLSPALEVASWYVWFLASAAYALGPAYQLQAMLHATGGGERDEVPQTVEAVG